MRQEKVRFRHRPKMGRTSFSIVEVPYERTGLVFPVLILDGPGGESQISVAAARYVAKRLKQPNHSYQQVRLFVRSYGQLHDLFAFKRNYEPLREDEGEDFIDDYVSARLKGTIDPEIGDMTGLLWQPTSQNVIANELLELARFSDYAARRLQHIPLVRWDQQFADSLRAKFRHFHESNNSVLAHLKNLSLDADKHKAPSPNIKRNRSKSQYSSFPPDRIGELYDAFRNDRDRLVFLLMAFGSLRISEPLHLFVSDIRPPDETGQPTVIVGDPSDGLIKWTGSDGVTRTTTRAVYLHNQYQRIPRDKIDETSRDGTEAAGFKGMMFDDKKLRASMVFFSEPSAGREFWRLHVSYMREYRLPIGNVHPYYFVNIDRRSEGYGRPLTLAAAESAFYAAAKRIGLTKDEIGISPHCLRHFYGYYVRNIRQLTLDQTKAVMHHESISTTMIYSKSSPGLIRQILRRVTESPDDEFDASKYFDEFRNRSLLLAL